MERDLPAAMSDGAVLLADRWAPHTDGGGGTPPPIVLLRSPYGRRTIGIVGRLLAERGYQAVIQSCRGTFGSGGEWDPFRHEKDDGHDTLAWLASQPWFGGSVVTFGPSYLGLVQWAVAEKPPEWLRAMAPAVTAANFRDAVVYPGDAFALETALTWVHQVEHQELPRPRVIESMLRANKSLVPGYGALPLSTADQQVVGRRVGFFQDWLAHERPGDAWWDPVDFRSARDTAPPATLLGGWYDIFLPAQVDDFTALRAAGRTAHLTIGPWTHASLAGMAASLRDALSWFGRYAGPHAPTDGGSARLPDRSSPSGGVRLFVMGSRRWVDVADWPPPALMQRWHLHSGGRLDPAPPGDGAPDVYRFDPADPTPGIGGPSLNTRNAGRKDQRLREERPDVLSYTSAPMTGDTTVAGPLTCDLHFRSSLEHTDVSVRLCVVSRKGRSSNVSDGFLRVRPGDVAPREDGTLHLRIRMWPTAVTFRQGERIRLQVSSGAHPLFSRNPGSGEPLATATSLRTARQEVFHDPGHPSAIELPVSPI